MTVNQNVNTANTFIDAAGKCAANASMSEADFKANIVAAMHELGLVLPAKAAKDTSKEWIGPKVVISNGQRGRGAERFEVGHVERSDAGKISYVLSVRAQSMLMDTLTRGVVAWYSKRYGSDLSPCYVHSAHKLPMILTNADVVKMTRIERGSLAAMQRTVNRLTGKLFRAGVHITLDSQTAKGKAGGSKPAAANKRADEAFNERIREVNALSPKSALAWFIEHGVTEAKLRAVAKYLLTN